ncbi:MAG TPA: M48 family metallopeptidase [Candidatus Eremiobacteraceae bacterium]|nr:M48 family metallopeptidase [Candidatus Eremiobacteraceae bacterium]
MTPLSPELVRAVDSIYPPARQALAYQIAAIGRPLYFVDSFVELALLYIFWRSGSAARWRAWFEERIRAPWLAAAAFAACSLCVFSIVLSPLSWYGGFVLPHRFGLSSAPLSIWFGDWVKGAVLTAVVGGLVCAGFVRLVARASRRWPVFAALIAAPLVLLGSAIYPIFIAPIFNHYTPLADSPLTRSILALAQRNGIDAKVVYEYDMSRQTNEGNAYVAGIGPVERIAIGDTLLRDLKPDEVLYVVAHEMGHYELGHLWLGSLYAWLGSILAIMLVALVVPRILARAPERARDLADPAALSIVAFVVLAASIVLAPVTNGLSRGIEHAADVFAADHTALGGTGVRAFARLGSENLSSLHPPDLAVWYFYDHPPLDERVEYAAEHARTTSNPVSP